MSPPSSTSRQALILLCGAGLAPFVLQIAGGARPAEVAVAEPKQGFINQPPMEWILQFDQKQQRLLDRLDDRMDELRRRLGQQEKTLISCG